MHATATLDAPFSAAAVETAGTVRYDIYGAIHKGLRSALATTLVTIGRCDPADLPEVETALVDLEQVLAICSLHIDDENRFLHPALERAAPGSSRRIGGEHVEHAEALDALRELAAVVRAARAEARGAALDRLYHALASFLADNLEHMGYEQTAHNLVLWAHYSDDELHALEGELVAAIPPAALMQVLRWMIPAMHAGERAGLFAGMRAGMPPEAYAAVHALAVETLLPHDLQKLERALAG